MNAAVARMLLLGAMAPTLAACSGWQSALDPQGPKAGHIAGLFWIFTAVCTVVWLAVVAVLIAALLRRRGERWDPLATDPLAQRRAHLAIAACAAATAVTLVALTVLSYATQVRQFAQEEPALTIRVTGHQWWWEITYEDPRPERRLTTANEIHIPVGRPVTIRLDTTDVIHSFWIPSLNGKIDQIPGQQNELQLVAERPGVYRGQCAEFCGFQPVLPMSWRRCCWRGGGLRPLGIMPALHHECLHVPATRNRPSRPTVPRIRGGPWELCDEASSHRDHRCRCRGGGDRRLLRLEW